jgi:hypothetical protein
MKPEMRLLSHLLQVTCTPHQINTPCARRFLCPGCGLCLLHCNCAANPPATICTPNEPATPCSISPVCVRCSRCLLHCLCPPPELRAADPDEIGHSLLEQFFARKVVG